MLHCLERRLDAATRALMGHSDQQVDFSIPPGELALVLPDSVSWRVFKNPVALFVGGVAAVILELAEPRVRAGIWEHSSFRTEPVARLQRTGLAAMVTVYGARSVAQAMIAGVNRAHARVQGVTPEGLAYRASDPELLDWVQATAAWGFLEAYSTYVRMVDPAERSMYFAEGEAAAGLYGARGAPTSQVALDALFERMLPHLEPSEVVFEFLAIMRAAPILPKALRWVQGALVRAAIEIVPASMRNRLELGPRLGLRAWEARLVRAAGAGADRLLLRSSPPVQACRRLGLPDDYLYR